MTPTLTYRSNVSGFDFAPSPASSELATNLRDQLKRLAESGQYAETLNGRAIRELQDAFLDSRCENWDGYGAFGVSDEAFMEASEFLSLTARRFQAPTASATPSGSLTLEWIASPTRRFIVSFRGEGQIAYAGVFGSSTVQGSAEFITDLPIEVSKLLSRLYLS